MLRHKRDVIRAQPQRLQRGRQAGVLPTSRRCQRAQSRRRNRSVDPIRERLGKCHHRQHRQAQFGRQVTACQQHRATALGLNEPTATPVVGAAVEALIQALRRHFRRVSRRVHRPEPDQRFHRQVVGRASNHELGLTCMDLVQAVLDRNRSRRTGGHRLNHGAVAANEVLHGVRRNHVRQGLLEDVLRVLLAKEAVHEQLPHGGHSTEPGALGRCDIGRVNGLQQLGRGEPGGEERIYRTNQVPCCDPVHAFQQRWRQTPLGGVVTGGELPTNRACQRGAPRQSCLRTRQSCHFPFAIFEGADAGEALVLDHVGLSGFAVRDREGDVSVEEHRRILLGAQVNNPGVRYEGAHTRPRHDLVAVTLENIARLHQVAVSVIPARLGGFRPGDQAHHPG